MSAPSNVAPSAEQDHQQDVEWLSEDYDDKHRKETAPLLFGDGSIDLQDPETPASLEGAAAAAGTSGGAAAIGAAEDDDEEEGASPSRSPDRKKKNYGSVDEKGGAGLDSKKVAAKGGKKKMPKSGGDEKKLSEAALAAKPHVPPINPCLWMFHLMQGVTVVASLCLVTTQIIPLLLCPRGEIIPKIGLLAIALKVYVSLFCLIFVLVELDLAVPFIHDSPLLQRFFSRGFVYSFVGLICVEEAYSERIRDIVSRKDEFHVGWAAIFMQISSWLMLAMGVLYMLLGICCLKHLKDKMRDDEREAWRNYRRDMKQWKELYQD